MTSTWKRIVVASIVGVSFAVVACGGEDVSLGKGTGELTSGDAGGSCTPNKCANQAVGCMQGQTVFNEQCVPDPHAGTGSSPAGACMLIGDCAQFDPGCGPHACDAQKAGCAIASGEPEKHPTNLKCVPDPQAGVGSNPVGHCILSFECAE
ncbi:hypothetical protein LZC95_49335 [Pendulispora brunnea]|uniref:Lipoprotein n=1 Tax=Pendulispora brunnea TaxID=2905690 RepID=A0ABZ2K6Y9_9BACT